MPCSGCPSLRGEPPLTFSPTSLLSVGLRHSQNKTLSSLTLPYLDAYHFLYLTLTPSPRPAPVLRAHLPVWGLQHPRACLAFHPDTSCSLQHSSTQPFYPTQKLLLSTKLGTTASPARPEQTLPDTASSEDTSPRWSFLHTPKKLQETKPNEIGANPGSVPTAEKGKPAWGWHSWAAPTFGLTRLTGKPRQGGAGTVTTVLGAGFLTAGGE